MDLPVLLAGPILRRVEATSVTVWLAFSKKQFVKLVIWNNGTEKCNEDTVKETQGAMVSSEPAETFEVSSKLHIALITVDTTGNRLAELKSYSYNIYFGDTATTLTNDLGTTGLLHKRGEPNPPGFLPLGYILQAFPTIVLPSDKLENLHIVHGSCRKIHGVGDDAFQQVDTMLKLNINKSENDTTKPTTRLQHLYLTGDQIYADETPRIVLPFINALAKNLFNDKTEKMVVKATATETKTIACEIQNFPPGKREFLINNTAKLTGNGISSHLLSFQEYCSTYLHYWSPDVWDPRLKQMLTGFKEQKYDDEAGSFHFYFLINIIKNFDAEAMAELLFKTATAEELAALKTSIAQLQTALKAPPPASLTPEQQSKVDKWKAAYQPGTQTFEGFDDIVKIMQLTDTLTPDDKATLDRFFTLRSTLNESRACCDFLLVLPLARRVLANVPTYMIFDDHDITDDWNFSQFWINRAHTSPLGIQVLRNALMAYTLFQDWGNVPAEYPVSLLRTSPTDPDYQTKLDNYSAASGKAKGNKVDLLQKISKYGKAISAGQLTETPGELSNAIDTLLLVGEAPATEIKFVTPVRWHYDIPTGKAHTFFLDTRTRREFDEFVMNPGLLSQQALDDQLPERIAQENYTVVFVVSPAPAVGLPVIEEFAQPISGILQGGISSEGVGGAPPGAISSALKRDNEGWGFSERHLEMFLQRLSLFKKAVILSGDVHFGYSCFVDYWKERKPDKYSRIIQLVSSPFKNGWDLDFTLLKSGFAQRLLTAYDNEFEKHAWKDKKLKINGDMPPRHRIRLGRNPIVLPRFGWNKETSIEPAEPDWVWRLRMSVDERYYNDVDQPDDPLFPDDVLSIADFSFVIENDLIAGSPANAAGKDAVKKTLLQMVERHHSLFMLGRTRRIVWQPHVGHVQFKTRSASDKFVLQHEFMYNCRTDGFLNSDTAPDPAPDAVMPMTTVHTMSLDVTDDEKKVPEILGKVTT
jgi:hypothetical protein